jgi:nucleotide-binding universal stress UspA family protein
VLGSATLALERASEDSSAVVVVRRAGGFGERLLSGSTSSHVATHASCPVVVVPFGARVGAVGPVVVAVGADSPAHAALAFAFKTARDTRTDLVVIHAVARGDTEPGRRALAETLAGWCDEYPEVTVTAQTVEGATVEACADAARDAGLLVLGRHRTIGHRAPWTRSIAKALLATTTCPVVTVPHDAVDLVYRPVSRAPHASSGPIY